MKHTKSLLAILIMLASFGQITTDLYLPSLPAMAEALTTHANTVQLSIALYLLGFSFSQLVYGSVSDALGRRKPLLFGLLLCFMGGLLCLLTPNIEILLIGRVLQGLGAGAASTLCRAIFRDCYSGVELSRYGSYLAIANILIIASAPVLGGYIQGYAGWRYNFGFLVFYNFAAMLLIMSLLPETNQHRHPENMTFPVLYKNIKTLLTSATFIGYNSCSLLTYAALIAWVTAGPILIQDTLGFSPTQYGWFCALGASGFLFGAFLNSQVVKRVGATVMLWIGLLAIIGAGVLMIGFKALGFMNIVVIMIPIVLMLFGASLVFPNAFAGMFQPFGKIAGMAAAFSGFLQILGGTLSSSLIALSHDHSQTPMGLAILMCGLTASGIYYVLIWRHRHP